MKELETERRIERAREKEKERIYQRLGETKKEGENRKWAARQIEESWHVFTMYTLP